MVQPSRKPRIWVRALGVVALLVFGYAAWLVYSFATGEARVSALCAQVRVGMTVAELQAFAVEHGFLRPQYLPADGETALAEIRTMGRFGCVVTLSAGAVKGARYVFHD